MTVLICVDTSNQVRPRPYQSVRTADAAENGFRKRPWDRGFNSQRRHQA